MPELGNEQERLELQRDPELLICSERLGNVCETLGYTESDVGMQARAQLIRAVQQAGHFNPNNEQHCDLLAAYQVAAEENLRAMPTPEAAIGYQLAQVKLWFDLDDPSRFYDILDLEGEEGVAFMLECTPGCEPHLRALLAIVNDIESLNTHK